jgi:Las17-binding protein actin regulator
MKKAMFLTAILSLGTLCWAGTAREDATDRLDNATDVVHAIMGAPDSGIPEEVLEHAKCIAAGTDWKLDTEILTYSRAKGAFAGLTLEGASIRQDDDSRHAIYGPKVTTRALLLGKVPAPSVTKPFLAEIRGAKAQAITDGKADDAKSEARSEAKENVTVTGCLRKGDDAGEFSIVAHDGKTWELHSNSIKLDNHLGHTVTVTGPRTHEAKAQEKAEEKREGVVKASSKEQYADLGVTSLKMVSETCK